MTAPRDSLQHKWSVGNRYANFGDAIIRIYIRGIRCHAQTELDITSPIMAISGPNGTGKSTILQMAAVAYANSLSPQYRISDFLVLSSLDPTPFRPNASVGYFFAHDDKKPKALTISRSLQSKRWNGYDRRKKHAVFFAGIGLYLPRIEKRDFVIRNAARIVIANSSDVASIVKSWTCKILGHGYEAMQTNTVTHALQSKSICSVTRKNTSYSETHMGFGEGRVSFMVQAIETLPDKSLVLLEEPETSLHQRAQHAFGEYLVDVCLRKGHQVLLTTHSQYLLKAFHSDSRVFLHHGPNGIQSLTGIAASQANSLLTDGHEKSLTILVEDPCAKILLSEIIRRCDATFLSTLGIEIGGSAEEIGRVARALKDTPCRVVAVRDGDKGASPRDFIFKLPGLLPPEKELLQNSHVQAMIGAKYSYNVSDFFAKYSGRDHHQWFQLLSQDLSADESTLVTEAAREYVSKAVAMNEATVLVAQLKDASAK